MGGKRKTIEDYYKLVEDSTIKWIGRELPQNTRRHKTQNSMEM